MSAIPQREGALTILPTNTFWDLADLFTNNNV
jgi:hypothetical protein